MAASDTDHWGLIRDTGVLYFNGENIIPLLVGSLIAIAGSIFSLGICAGPLMLGYTNMAIRISQGERVEIGDVGWGFSRFGTAFVLALLAVLVIILGTIVIIGGVIAAFFFTFAFHVLATDPKAEAIDALKASVGIVKNNLTDVLVFWVVAIVLNALLGATAIGGILSMSFTTLLFGVVFVKIAPQAGLTSGAATSVL